MARKFETIELLDNVDISDDIKHKVKTVGVKGLDFNKASELGVFTRIANLLCVAHATVMSAYRIYGGVDYLIDQLQARRNDIAQEMNRFDKAFDRFVSFWTNYYAKGKTSYEVNFETERLYHQIMHWMQMPEEWQLGDAQRTIDNTDLAIRVDSKQDEKVYTFRKAEVNPEIKELKESWSVFMYNIKTNIQTCLHSDMEKADAMMVAKRLSAEDKTNIYTVSLVRDVVERKTVVIPFKAFRANETIGKITKTLKD